MFALGVKHVTAHQLRPDEGSARAAAGPVGQLPHHPNYASISNGTSRSSTRHRLPYFATRLAGAPPYIKGNPPQGLTLEQMKQLQTKLKALGHDVGDIDGILGGGTRVAIQQEQARSACPPTAGRRRNALQALIFLIISKRPAG